MQLAQRRERQRLKNRPNMNNWKSAMRIGIMLAVSLSWHTVDAKIGSFSVSRVTRTISREKAWGGSEKMYIPSKPVLSENKPSTVKSTLSNPTLKTLSTEQVNQPTKTKLRPYSQVDQESNAITGNRPVRFQWDRGVTSPLQSRKPVVRDYQAASSLPSVGYLVLLYLLLHHDTAPAVTQHHDNQPMIFTPDLLSPDFQQCWAEWDLDTYNLNGNSNGNESETSIDTAW